MDRSEKKKLFGRIRYATLENTWFSLVVVIILFGGLFLACIAIGLILVRAGASTDVLRWITPTAYLAWLAIRARMIVRTYRSALRNVKIWLQFLGAAAVAVFAAQIDPWWIGVVTFFGVLTIFEFINLLVISGKANEPLFRRDSDTRRDSGGRDFAMGTAGGEWVFVGESGLVVAYADPATIRRSGDMVTMWSLYDFKTVQENPIAGKPYFSERTQIEYDCKGERSRILYLLWHSGRMGGGDVVYDILGPDKWIPISPGSIIELLCKFACGKTSAAAEERDVLSL